MRFAIAYVIGDTEQHDRLCGKFQSRNVHVRHLCRHCNCPTRYSSVPRRFQTCQLWKPADLHPVPKPTGDNLTMWQTNHSHHYIDNVFHQLDFGAGNEYGIHFATPRELLHMHQLGVAKGVIESFQIFVLGSISSSYKCTKEDRKKACHELI